MDKNHNERRISPVAADLPFIVEDFRAHCPDGARVKVGTHIVNGHRVHGVAHVVEEG